MFRIFGRAAKLTKLKKTLHNNILYAAGYIANLEDIASDDDLLDAIQQTSVLVLEDFQAYLTFDEMEPPIACIITPDFTLKPTPTSNNYHAWFSLMEVYDVFPEAVMSFSRLCSKMVARKAMAAQRVRVAEALSNEALDQDAQRVAEAIAGYVLSIGIS